MREARELKDASPQYHAQPMDVSSCSNAKLPISSGLGLLGLVHII